MHLVSGGEWRVESGEWRVVMLDDAAAVCREATVHNNTGARITGNIIEWSNRPRTDGTLLLGEFHGH